VTATTAGPGRPNGISPFATVLPQELRRRAELHPDRPFLAWQHEPYWSYAAVDAAVARLAGGLRALGVEPGDTVAIMLPNSLELLLSWFAANFLGAVEVPVNVNDRGIFLEHVLSDSRARVLVTHDSLLAEIEACRPRLPALATVVVVGSPRLVPGLTVIGYDEVAAAPPVAGPAQLDYRDLMAILYTSGTSGPAKGVMMSYGHSCVSARPFIDAVGLTEDDVFFICMPLFHSNAQIIQLLPALLTGARASIWPGFDAARWLEEVTAVHATVTNTLGVMCLSVFGQPPRDSDAANPLRVVQTIPAPAAIARAFEERFAVRCVDGYGLTDGAMLSFRPAGAPLVPGSCGRPLDTFDLVIADPDTDEPVPAGTIGEILVRPRVPFGFMSGYWRNPEATAAAWRNLWFHTGDAGYLDADGLLYFHDRLKDVIRVRGENVSSAMIEAVVRTHPAVAECAAVAVPAAADDDVKICVVLVAGAALAPEELIEHCRPQMPYFAIPSYVEFHPSLPVTSTNKIRKVLLRGATPGVATWDRRAVRRAAATAPP
jgi:carnitine-CoA ligase